MSASAPALLVLLLVSAATTLAQPASERVETDPVTCWWRTSATAVRVGEPFDVILTCSLLEAEAARVVADESRLDPAVVQLQPFEVVGGTRADDVTTAGRRFIQYEYRLRAIAENVFAAEVALPPLEIAYRVESRVAEGNTVAGRDRTYVLPPLTLRVLSLVPDTADDIREAPVPTFGDISDRRSRGLMFRAAGAGTIVVGAVLLGLALVGALKRRRVSRAPAESRVRHGAVLAEVRRELAAVQELARRSGWTDDLVARALTAIRIVAAYASGRPVTQRRLPTAAVAGAGELAVRSGGTGVAVSSTLAVTDDEELRDALARLTAARYGRAAAADPGLDDAVETAFRRAERVSRGRPFREGLWTRWRR